MVALLLELLPLLPAGAAAAASWRLLTKL